MRTKLFGLAVLLLLAGTTTSLRPDPEGRLAVGVIGAPESLRQRVEAALLDSPFCTVVAIQDRKALLDEIALGQSGLIKESRRVGELLGARKMLIVFQEAETSTIRLVDTETGIVEAALVGSDAKSFQDLGFLQRSLNRVLEGRAVVRNLERLDPAEARIKVRVDLPARKLQVGQNLRFTIHSDRSGYLTIFDIQPDGTFLPLIPNRFGLSRRIEAQKPYAFPGPRLELTASPPTGVDTLYVLVTAQPFSIPSRLVRVEDGVDVFEPGKGDEISRGFALKVKSLPPGDWGLARIEITTHP